MKDKKKFYINGKWVNPIKPKDFDVINPSTEEVCSIISPVSYTHLTLPTIYSV